MYEKIAGPSLKIFLKKQKHRITDCFTLIYNFKFFYPRAGVLPLEIKKVKKSRKIPENRKAGLRCAS